MAADKLGVMLAQGENEVGVAETGESVGEEANEEGGMEGVVGCSLI